MAALDAERWLAAQPMSHVGETLTQTRDPSPAFSHW
jgi:hypothetical protein